APIQTNNSTTPTEPDYDEENDPELENIELKTTETKSAFEIDKESLKPTISHSSEINLNPAIKEKEPEAANDDTIKTDDETFVIEKSAEEDVVEENLASKLVA